MGEALKLILVYCACAGVNILYGKLMNSIDDYIFFFVVLYFISYAIYKKCLSTTVRDILGTVLEKLLLVFMPISTIAIYLYLC